MSLTRQNTASHSQHQSVCIEKGGGGVSARAERRVLTPPFMQMRCGACAWPRPVNEAGVAVCLQEQQQRELSEPDLRAGARVVCVDACSRACRRHDNAAAPAPNFENGGAARRAWRSRQPALSHGRPDNPKRLVR
ncbi:hypothetical protein MHYP_G00096800 [Metynnis hypsauchen]